MRTLRHAAIMASLLILAACNWGGGSSSGSSDSSSGGTTGTSEMKDANAKPADAEMTREEAIAVVKSEADKGTLRVTISHNYTQWSTTQQRCTPMEAEYSKDGAGPCRPRSDANDFSQYWKPVQTQRSVCCTTDSVRFPGGATWDATWSGDDRKWHVTADFGIDGTTHHATWTVDRETRKFDEVPLPKGG